jgi:hypothetical protein
VIEGEAGRPWKVTNNFIAGGSVYRRAEASALTPARESLPPFMYPGGSYVFDGAASYAKKVTKFRIEVNRGVDDNIQTTGLNPEDVAPLNFDVSIDATIKYESRDFYEKIQYGQLNATNIPIDLPTGSFEAVSIVSSYIARVVLPLIHWTDAKVNKLDPDGKTVYMDVVGMGIKNATHQIFAAVDSGSASSGYLA